MEDIKPAFLVGRIVLFVVDTKCGIEENDYVESGDVISVDEERMEATICFRYHFYKSTTEVVPFSHILSVHDETNGLKLEIDAFSGRGHDLRGKTPFGTHPLAHAK